MNGMAEFGALIKSARERRGWTQTELGNRLGYTHNFVVRVERGAMTNPPDPNTLRNMERELGVPRQKMLQAMGYLDNDRIEEDADTITISRDDPRAYLLRILEGHSDRDVRKLSMLAEVMLDYSATDDVYGQDTPDVQSVGKTTTTEENGATRSA